MIKANFCYRRGGLVVKGWVRSPGRNRPKSLLLVVVAFKLDRSQISSFGKE